jgi:tetratricopeptide (TPR) repeat protein
METRHASKTHRIPILWVCVVCLLAPAVVQAEEWYVSYEEGIDAFHEQRWEAAIRLFNQAIAERSDPGANAKTYGLHFIDYFPYLYRGVAFYRTSNFQKASQDIRASERYGEVYDASNDDDAERLLQEHLALLRQFETDRRTFAEAENLYRQKQYPQAIERFKAIGSTSPLYTEAQRYISQADAQKGRVASSTVDEPKEKEKKETEVKTVDRTARDLQSGISLFNRKRYDAAETKFRAVLSLDPGNGQALHYLRRIRAERQKIAAATPPKREPTTKDRSTTRSTTLKDTEQPAKPKATPARDITDSLFNAGRTWYDHGQLQKAKEAFHNLRARKPSHAGAEAYIENISRNEQAVRQGVLSYFKGDYGEAITLLAEAAKVNRENTRLYGFLASAYAARYYLGGTEDTELQRHAIDAYRVAQEIDATYSLDTRYVSPKIIAMLNRR